MFSNSYLLPWIEIIDWVEIYFSGAYSPLNISVLHTGVSLCNNLSLHINSVNLNLFFNVRSYARNRSLLVFCLHFIQMVLIFDLWSTDVTTLLNLCNIFRICYMCTSYVRINATCKDVVIQEVKSVNRKKFYQESWMTQLRLIMVLIYWF